jgi:hypothetical protein
MNITLDGKVIETPEDAISAIRTLTTAFRFTGQVFTPGDVRAYLYDLFSADGIERDVTDADVEEVVRSSTWRHSIEEHLRSEGYDIILSVIEDRILGAEDRF